MQQYRVIFRELTSKGHFDLRQRKGAYLRPTYCREAIRWFLWLHQRSKLKAHQHNVPYHIQQFQHHFIIFQL